MKTRRIVMVSILFIAVALAATVILVRRGLRALPTVHRVELTGGEIVEGIVFPLYDEKYAIQEGDRCLIVKAEEIHGVDGEREGWGRRMIGGGVVSMQETFEEILPDGDIEVRSAQRVRNEGTKAWRDIRWGMAPHELELLDTFQFLDVWGNSLPVRAVGDRPGGGKKIRAELRRPLLPGEESWFTSRFIRRGGVLREGDVRIYRHMGNYPDNRLVTRSILLPENAEILSVDPEPLYKVRTGQRWLVVWRRYFVRLEEIPWEIRFRTPPADSR